MFYLIAGIFLLVLALRDVFQTVVVPAKDLNKQGYADIWSVSMLRQFSLIHNHPVRAFYGRGYCAYMNVLANLCINSVIRSIENSSSYLCHCSSTFSTSLAETRGNSFV